MGKFVKKPRIQAPMSVMSPREKKIQAETQAFLRSQKKRNHEHVCALAQIPFHGKIFDIGACESPKQ